MENASKALIIAGAILISILLISVGIIIMNAINNPVQQAANSADSQAVQSFNSEFLQYEGVQSGSTIRGLISTVNAHNRIDETNQIELNETTEPSAADMPGGALNSASRYDVELSYDGEAGRIKTITVTAH